jgi:hypothetical protein
VVGWEGGAIKRGKGGGDLCPAWPASPFCAVFQPPALKRLPTAPAFPALPSALVPPAFYPYSSFLQTSRDIEELTRFLDESVEAGTEGLIVKTVAGEP